MADSALLFDRYADFSLPFVHGIDHWSCATTARASRVRSDDAAMLEVAGLFRGAGAADDATLRLLAVYADNLRRIAKAEADYYEAHIERRLRAKGLDERQLIEIGTQLGDRVIGLLERVRLMVYRRRREHVWTEHAINHVEEALESSGLQQRVPQPPAICFVDLTGYTRLTEERGDEAAAQVAGRLVALVNDISRRRGGRPVRWLGDGGMFYFRQPGTAVVAGLDLVDRAATSPCGHPHRPCHLTRRRRLRRDGQPGGSDRFLCTRRAGGSEPRDGAALRRAPGVVPPARSRRAQRRRQTSAALPGPPQVLGRRRSLSQRSTPSGPRAQGVPLTASSPALDVPAGRSANVRCPVRRLV
jgi:hypothetical protein